MGFLFYSFKKRPLQSESEPETDAANTINATFESKDEDWENPTLHAAKANIAPLPDGGVIVYPGLFQRHGYRLNKEQFEDYWTWLEKRNSRKYWNLSIFITLIAFGGAYFVLREMNIADPMAWLVNAALLVVVGVLVYLSYWPKRQFRGRFPDAPAARDPNRGKRRLLTYLTNPMMSFGTCIFGAAFLLLLLPILMPSELNLVLNGDVRIENLAEPLVMLLLLPLVALFYGYLTVHHILFRRRFGRPPTKADLDDPEILNAL